MLREPQAEPWSAPAPERAGRRGPTERRAAGRANAAAERAERDTAPRPRGAKLPRQDQAAAGATRGDGKTAARADKAERHERRVARADGPAQRREPAAEPTPARAKPASGGSRTAALRRGAGAPTRAQVRDEAAAESARVRGDRHGPANGRQRQRSTAGAAAGPASTGRKAGGAPIKARAKQAALGGSSAARAGGFARADSAGQPDGAKRQPRRQRAAAAAMPAPSTKRARPGGKASGERPAAAEPLAGRPNRRQRPGRRPKPFA
jgi:hypothetical protein